MSACLYQLVVKRNFAQAGSVCRMMFFSVFILRNEFGSNQVGDEPRARLQLKTGHGGISIAKSVEW
jgi:hypothetical protein